MRHFFATLISIIVALIIFISIFYFTETSLLDILKAVNTAGKTGSFLVIAFMIMQLVMQTWSWQILLDGSTGKKIKFWILFQAVLTGWAGNFVTPSMYIGGEPIRAYVLQKYSGMSFKISFASVLVHKFIEFATFLIFILIGVCMTWLRFAHVLPLHVEITMLFCVIGLVIIWIGLAISMFRRYRILSKVISILIRCKIGVKFLQRHLNTIFELEDSIFGSLQQYKKATLLSFLVMLIFDIFIFIRPLAFFGWNILDFGSLAFIFLATQLILSLQFTPGGIGCLEGGLVAIFAILHISAPQALAYALLCRIGDILIVAAGFALISYLGIQKSQHEPLVVSKEMAVADSSMPQNKI